MSSADKFCKQFGLRSGLYENVGSDLDDDHLSSDPHFVFCPVIRKLQAFEILKWAQVVNGESRKHPISPVKYNLYLHCNLILCVNTTNFNICNTVYTTSYNICYTVMCFTCYYTLCFSVYTSSYNLCHTVYTSITILFALKFVN